MLPMREHSVQCLSPDGLHRMVYTEWGDPSNPKVLICVHGLTRCGRDFDFLAECLSSEYRVICPDVVGRGKSDWLKTKSLYIIPQYVSDMVTLIARLDVATVHWVGTSMGGLIGMGLAAQANSPVTRLILNDVGPVLTAAALWRIAAYVGQAPRFANYADAEDYLRSVSATFGALSDAQWRHLTEHVVRRAADGKFEFIYDPGIAQAMQPSLDDGKDVELWPVYDAVRCPTLVMRGEHSDLLTRDTALSMASRGPRASIVEIEGVGHAPMLLDLSQVAIVANFLRTP